MDNKKKLDFHTDNLALPEVTVDEDENITDDNSDDTETDIAYENLAFPEIHIKSSPAKKTENQ